MKYLLCSWLWFGWIITGASAPANTFLGSYNNNTPDIGKKIFVDHVQDWIKDFIAILDEERRTDIKIETSDLIGSLRTKLKNPDFPISIVLWKHLKTTLNTLPASTTAEGLRGALLNGFNAFHAEMGSKLTLTQHFKDNRTTYRSIKRKELDKQVMLANDFEVWLVAILKTARKKKEKRQEELLATQEERETAFKTAYGAWLADQRQQMLYFVLEKDKRVVDSMAKETFIERLLEVNEKWQRVQPELAQEITQKIRTALEAQPNAVLSMDDYISAMNTAYTNITTPEAIIARNWYNQQQFLDIGELIEILNVKD